MSEDDKDISRELQDDFRLGLAYAARAGLLTDQADFQDVVLDKEGRLSADGGDIKSLSIALSAISKLIFPVTISDLRSGRDPCAAGNQRQGKKLHLVLTIFALAVMMLIGFYMRSLHRDQAAIETLRDIQQLKPLEKLTSLRKMAQWENPLITPSSLYDQYHQKVSELRQIKDRIQNSYIQAKEAKDTPLFPFFNSSLIASTAESLHAGSVAHGSEEMPRSTAQGIDVPKNSLNNPVTSLVENPRPFCSADEQGGIILPRESLFYPEWMKNVLSDSLSDFCFQLKILSPSGDSALLNQNFSGSSFIAELEERVVLRTNWILPFLYGLLGASIFVLRNIANIRTPVMGPMRTLMRLSLGGLAGIVIGWFSIALTAKPEIAGVVSFPYVLAFIAGYWIDVLFAVMDRVSNTVEQAVTRSFEVKKTG